MFFKGSRYAGVGEAVLVDVDGRSVPFKRIRFIPTTTGRLTERMIDGDRLDLLANRVYRDVDRAFRICDANLCVHPDELERRAVEVAEGATPDAATASDLSSEPARSLIIPPAED